MSGADRCHRRAKGFAAVGRAVIGHDPLDADALTGEPSQGAAEKSDRALFFLVRRISLYARREASSMQTCLKASEPMP